MRRLTSPTGLLVIGYTALALASIRALSHELRSSQPAFLHDALARFAWMGDTDRDTPLLAFVFSFRDCSAALRAGRLWNALHRGTSVRVRGVMLEGPEDAIARSRFLVREGIEFPVTRALDEKLAMALAALGYDSTPVTILTDARRRPRLIGPATLDSLEQTAFMELVLAQIDRLSRPSLEAVR